MFLKILVETMNEQQRVRFEQFKSDLAKHRFSIATDFEGVDALTVKRGVDNIADIYSDGRITTSFTGFRNLNPREKIEVTKIICNYVCLEQEDK